MMSVSGWADVLFEAPATQLGGDERFWGAVIAVAAAVLFSGFWIPLLARLRAGRVDTQHVSEKETEGAQTKKAYWDSLSKRGSLSVLQGQDGRLSSSKTVAYAWTFLVLYILTVLILTWPTYWTAALHNLSPTYLLLLGGPYASLVLSKAIVTTRTTSGSLTKPSSDGSSRLTDLIADDSGRVDLFDVQFVVFNVMAMWFVIKAFGEATSAGFPEIPSGLVILTGGPAAVYLSNKLFTSTTATISSVTPSRVKANTDFFIVGSGFLTGYIRGVSPESSGIVEVGGRQASSDFNKWTDTRIPATAPTLVTGDTYPARVTVTGPGGVSATLDGALTVEQ